MAVRREEIFTAKAPNPVGPYSQAIRAGKTVYIAGQLGIDAATGKLVEGGVSQQARQVLDNLSAIVAEAGGSLADIVKTTVFLQDFDDFQKMNAVYAEYFGDAAPARSTIGVSRLPANAAVEIEAVLVLNEGGGA